MEEGEVVAVAERGPRCYRSVIALVWPRTIDTGGTAAGSVAGREGDVEVGEVCRGESVGECEGLESGNPGVERGEVRGWDR